MLSIDSAHEGARCSRCLAGPFGFPINEDPEPELETQGGQNLVMGELPPSQTIRVNDSTIERLRRQKNPPREIFQDIQNPEPNRRGEPPLVAAVANHIG